MTILRTVVTVNRVSGTGGTATVELNAGEIGTDTRYSAIDTSVKTASNQDLAAVGEFTGPSIRTALLASVADAEDVASYLAGVNSAYPQLASIIIDNVDDTRLAVIRDIDLSDRITATESVTGAEIDGFVEQIEHTITNGGLSHQLRILVYQRARLTGIFTSDAVSPDVFSQFTDTPPASFNYAVFGY
jgi:hypothetical protein